MSSVFEATSSASLRYEFRPVGNLVRRKNSIAYDEGCEYT